MAKKPPVPKRNGIIRKTDEWKKFIYRLEKGYGETVLLPPGFGTTHKILHPVESFLAALRRWNKRNGNKFEVYNRGGIIYAIRRVGA